jgi:multiple sugar transport system substrate-binding protein
MFQSPPTWISALRSRSLRWTILALVTCLTVLVASLVAWSQESVTISFLVRAVEAQQLQILADEFEAENPGIKIDMVEGPNAADSVENLYTTSFLLGDSPYDLVYSDVVWIPKFAAAGWLQDLSDRVSDDELSQFLEADVAAGRYQGGLYRMPFRSAMGMLYYRTDLLEDIGAEPPETFKDLIAAAHKFRRKPIPPGATCGKDCSMKGLITNFVEIIAGYGGFWVDPDTLEVGLDQDPEAIKAVDFMRHGD